MTSTEVHLTEVPVGFRYVSTARPRLPLTDQEYADMEKPKVLIVGAGLGGVTLGILLERAGIPFQIYERANEVKPLGSAIAVGPNVMLCFKQLGIFDDLVKLGKPMVLAQSYNNSMEITQVTDWSVRDKLGGDQHYVVARPCLYDLLRSRIPPHKILMNKRVLSILQNENGVMIRCSDNNTHHGDILVGADGAYSGVRQSMYQQLKKQKKLPKSDDCVLPYSCTCLVGQTEVLDPEEFPELNETNSKFHGISEFPYSHHLNKDSAKDNDSFRNSEWGPETAETMCKEVGHLKIPGGNGKLTMKDLIDRTPKHLISKAMLEEKVFSTWYHRRTVLLGDACHKMHPAAGQGAVNAMQDAITLVNVIASLPSKEMDDITECFKIYKSERYPPALAAFNMSHTLSKSFEKTLQGALVRYTMMYMPPWLNKIAMAKLIQVRPQVNFLPRAEDRGTIKAKYQPSLHRKVTFAAPPAVASAAVEATTVV
ncbi:hypothetical protein BGZ82_007514 [Podila clonocystis]|nr:hypothetical protein BGZ82_007514 [Podila clonocystis]